MSWSSQSLVAPATWTPPGPFGRLYLGGQLHGLWAGQLGRVRTRLARRSIYET